MEDKRIWLLSWNRNDERVVLLGHRKVDWQCPRSILPETAPNDDPDSPSLENARAFFDKWRVGGSNDGLLWPSYLVKGLVVGGSFPGSLTISFDGSLTGPDTIDLPALGNDMTLAEYSRTHINGNTHLFREVREAMGGDSGNQKQPDICISLPAGDRAKQLALLLIAVFALAQKRPPTMTKVLRRFYAVYVYEVQHCHIFMLGTNCPETPLPLDGLDD